MDVPTKIFIIPYRARFQHKHHFDVYMKYILEDLPKNDYKIFFVHQCDDRPFNRGAMKNIGFLAMKKLYPDHYKNITFVFNDIDIIPYKKNFINYNTTLGTVKHFYGFTFALGGIVCITGADFEKCKGYPNYWGWGLEDNAMYNKVIANNIKVDRSQFFKMFDHNILQFYDTPSRMLTKEEIWKYSNNINDECFHDINNLNYTIENEFIQVESFNTKYNANSQTYYKSETPQRIEKDKKYKFKSIGNSSNSSNKYHRFNQLNFN
jgi:hypothetical protein